MIFRSKRAMRRQWPHGAILQLRMITALDSTVDAEGPAESTDAATFACQLAMGLSIPEVIKHWKAKWKVPKS